MPNPSFLGTALSPPCTALTDWPYNVNFFCNTPFEPDEVETFKPSVVGFHFGLPCHQLLARVKHPETAPAQCPVK